jgi:hypothetical protein
MSTVEWASVAVTGGLGLTGYWVASSLRLRRRTELESAAIERRWDAYKHVWKETQAAAPMRNLDPGVPLPAAARAKIYDALTTWWFAEGGGMLLGDPTRQIYLTAKHNLTCPDAELRPAEVATYVCAQPDPEAARSALAIRQLSLLRTAMRADLGIVAGVYGPDLDARDRAFLRHARAPLWKQPWWTGRWRDWPRERIAARRVRRSPERPEPLAERSESPLTEEGLQPQRSG